jgi:pyruvate kinase
MMDCPEMYEIEISNLSQDSIEYISINSYTQNGRFDQLIDSNFSKISYKNTSENKAIFNSVFNIANPLKKDYIITSYSSSNTLKKIYKIRIIQTNKNECNKGCDYYEIPFYISVNDSVYKNNIQGFKL